MTEIKDQNVKKATLTLGAPKLKLGEFKGGQVPQSLSHGRVKSVTVEVKKKRRMPGDPQSDSKSVFAGSEFDVKRQEDDIRNAEGLTEDERTSRLKALHFASQEDKRKKLVEEERRKQEEERLAEEERLRAEAEAQRKAKEAANLANGIVEEVARPARRDDRKTSDNDVVRPIRGSDKIVNPAVVLKDAVKEKPKRDEKEEDREKPKVNRGDQKRRSGRITLAQALTGADVEEKMRSLASVKRAREKAKRLAAGDSNKEKEKVLRDIIIPEIMTVQELANRMAERVYDVTKALMKMGMMVTANQSIDADTAELVVVEFGHRSKRVTDADVEDILKLSNANDEGKEIFRAPVVTFMGHVDHGKTSLLDAIRKANVASGEAGGITQHIGAYQVKVDEENKITFLDTPGHEAFTEMRKRGATATDIVVLVVAADDGIMAQTVEAINHAKAAEVPIIIAINKVDKPGADPLKVRNALLEHHLVTEDFGGDVLSVEVSAKTGKNLDKLLEAILLQSEVLELSANPDRAAEGVVIEARMDKNRGPVATLLVQKGNLKIGDIVIAGETVGRIRAMVSDSGQAMKGAGPSVPVEVLGLDAAPEAGAPFNVVETEKQAREIKEYRQKRNRDLKVTLQRKKGSLEDLFLQAKDGGKKQLPILIKGDVQGSVEAIIGSLGKLETSEVGVKVLHSAVGGITTSDVSLAGASNAIVLGFNVRADSSAKELSDRDGIDIRYYSIIYDLIDDIKARMGGMLAPVMREKYLGIAEIRDVFNITKSGKVAGCYVTEGMIKRGAGVRLLRDNVVIHAGKLKTLKRFKDDVKEVATNFECGMAFENYEDMKVGDRIEAFELIEEQRTL